MIGFFNHAKQTMLKEGIDESAFTGLFGGIKGFVLLDTCGNEEQMRRDIEASGIDLPILEVCKVGLENVLRVVRDAIDHA